MASRKGNNYAFIDAQNLYLGIRSLGWRIDYAKFRVYLKEKYSVARAYVFIGYIPENAKFYAYLKRSGFICIFKQVSVHGGAIKGNVDAELVLHTMIQFPNFKQAILVSGDGDFLCLAEYLLSKNKLQKVLVPNGHRYSSLLKTLNSPGNKIVEALSELRHKIGNEKGSRRDGTRKEPNSS